MKPVSQAKIANLNFICDVIQRNRKRPKKYKHYLQMSQGIYQELRNNFIINMEQYYLDETAFIEVFDGQVRISFISLYMCEDLHRKIDHYIIKKFMGKYPIIRGGIFF